MFGLVRKSKLEEKEEALAEAKECAVRERNRAVVKRNACREMFAELERLPKKYDAVETFDEPRKAYKSVCDGIVKLVVPSDTPVVYPTMENQTGGVGLSKLRTAEVIVVEIEGSSRESASHHTQMFRYKEGERLTPDRRLNKDTLLDCTSGIHLFRTECEAREWHSHMAL